MTGIIVAGCGDAGRPSASVSSVADGGQVADGADVNRTEPFEAGEMLRVDAPRSDDHATDSEVASVVHGDRALGVDLLRTVADGNNVMVSPYSVATALSMLYAGARGATAEEIARVMHLEVDQETLHIVRNQIEQQLSATPPPPEGEDDTRQPFALRPANSAWGQGGYPFLDDYLNVLATYYGAGLQLLDFADDPGGSTDIINQWTEDATEGRITDLIPPGVIDDLTRLVLVNAIWFKANWSYQFSPEATGPGTFHLLDGTEVTVPMMHGSFHSSYAETPLFRAVRIPYAGDASMVVLMPQSGTPGDLLEELSAGDFDIPWREGKVQLTLPSFEFESDVALGDSLQSLGMRAAFQPPSGDHDGADLTGITAVRELFVSQALHKTFVAVDESGTEAAAATALVFEVTSAGLSPEVVEVDRPFLFWIEHTSTGEPLFLGQVVDPSPVG